MDDLKNLPDHDILILLSGQVQGLTNDIKELKDNHSRRVAALEAEKANKDEVYRIKHDADNAHEDYEKRLRSIEKEQSNFKGKYAISATLIVIVITSIFSFIIKKI